MPKPLLLFAAAMLVLGAAPPALAQAPDMSASQQDAPVLTLARVFESPSLGGPTPRAPKLSPDGRWLTVLKSRDDDRERYDLWGFDRLAGQWTMLVDSLKLSSGRELTEAQKMQRERLRIGDLKGVVSYDWSADSKSVLVPVEGELYLAGLDGGVIRIPATTGEELNAKLSPKGAMIAYVRGRRLYAGPTGAEAQAITPEEASDTVHWGEAEFVAQEEMARMTGFWWAPDDSRIAVERFDAGPVGVVTRAAIGADGTKVFDQRYPAAGTPNADVSLWVMNPDGSGRVEVDLGAEKDIYLARVDWAPDGKTLHVQRENRLQTRLDMLAVDPATGASRVLFSEQAPPKSWVNLSDAYRFLDDGSLIWWSERDGFGHLYLYKGGQWKQLTKGDWVVTALVGVDQKKGRVFFTATRDDVLAQQVYSLDLAHPDQQALLTDLAYVNAASMDDAGQTLMVTRSNDTQPPQSYIADADGKRLAWIEENRVEGDHPYAPYMAAHRSADYGTIRADDGTLLHWMMITPPLEPGRRYPVFSYHYGGPHAQVVTKAWHGALAQAIVAKGYVYFAIDNRGSENRGVQFESPLWRAMGSVEVEDQLAGAEWVKRLPFVDPARVSTFGWSYGGYMPIKMLEKHPGAWAAGIAVAPVTRWQLYDTHYTERYLGLPQDDPAVYEGSNALADTAKIADPLLIVHGMADDNVVLDNTTEIVAKMQREAVPFEMMLYPGMTHHFAGPTVNQQLYETMFRFLDRNGAGTADR